MLAGSTSEDYRMHTAGALRAAITGQGAERVLTLDRAFQGLPDTAHGGSVLAVFDALAGLAGPRTLAGHYLRRVPLGAPLRLRAREAHLELSDDSATLVSGRVSPAAPA